MYLQYKNRENTLFYLKFYLALVISAGFYLFFLGKNAVTYIFFYSLSTHF